MPPKETVADTEGEMYVGNGKFEKVKPEYSNQGEVFVNGKFVSADSEEQYSGSEVYAGNGQFEAAPADAVSLIKKYFPESEWDNAIAVMMGESGGNAGAHNGNAGTGDDSWGLFQINRYGELANTRPPVNQLLDPEFNVKYAAQMWQSQGWGPWGAAKKIGLV